MNKIKITKNQFNNLIKLQSVLPVTDATNTMGKPAENMLEAKTICSGLDFEVNELYDKIHDAECHLYDKNIGAAIGAMGEYIDKIQEIQKDIKDIANYLAASISTLIDATEISTFTVTAKSEEIQQVIDTNFEKCPVMSIGFKDGVYALLFGEDEESIDIEPFIFARGDEDDYETARHFIEGFLDLEDID